MPESTITFEYVTDLYDHNVLHEDDSVLKELGMSHFDYSATVDIDDHDDDEIIDSRSQ